MYAGKLFGWIDMADEPQERATIRIEASMKGLVWPAILSSFRKLDPRERGPQPGDVRGEVARSVILPRTASGREAETVRAGSLSCRLAFWLWFTVLFANFATAMAEGRGKAQADTLRKMRTETFANLVTDDGVKRVPATSCARATGGGLGGETIPGDGDVIEGIASVDESAITGESAPVIRESGGDRQRVTGGTKVLSDQIRVQITSNPGESFLDRMIGLVEGAQRQKTPNEIALTILLAALTIIFVIVILTLEPFAIYDNAVQSPTVLIALLVCLIPTTIGGLLSAIGIAGMDRLVRHNVLPIIA